MNATVEVKTVRSDLPALGPGPGAVCVGRAHFLDADLQQLADAQGPSAAWAAAFARHGTAAPGLARGDFAVAARDPAGRVMLAVDRFAVRTLCYRADGDQIRFATRADALGGVAEGLDAQALFDYFYFHVIPAPRTIYREVRRVPGGHCVVLDRGAVTVTPWWQPRFEDRAQSFAALRDEFRALLELAVAEQAGRGTVGCFLSGGTDSSTVTGMLGRVTGEAPQTFSIGFEAEGYDEMAYARVAARHFNARHHEYYVTPDDLVRSIPDIAAAFDQPFGNSSVVPAFYCARMAVDAGVDTLLAGDGGDEVFGGNTRYARQRVLAAYECIPQAIRRRAIEPLVDATQGMDRIPLFGKARSYVEQARVPMPDRLQAYNLLGRLGVEHVLAPEFLARVDAQRPQADQRAVYEVASATSVVDRMLAYDWKYTLADNDLRKVTIAASLAGVATGFPLLDARVVDFSLRLPATFKVRGLTLRWFFKKALRGFLPDEVISKRKHGFGLPFGIWMTRDARLRAFAIGSLEHLRDRGLVRTEFLDRLENEYLERAPGYYGEMVWILMMLSQWMNASRRSGSA